MLKAFSPLLQMGVMVLGYLYTTSDIAIAQITSDGTVNTQVDTESSRSTITGGEQREGNLFHSFQDFSVPANGEAFFDNTTDISTIFSRVTGGNISNIDGVIRANGSASLFLINPAGIIFGENASLDIGGSFLATTADSILFEGGEFSAVDLDNPPLLTVNAPIGLDLRNDSAAIVNRSQYQKEATESPDLDFDAPIPDFNFEVTENENVPDLDLPDSDFNSANPVGLQVEEGQAITFVAGSILFEGGLVTAPGGEINLEARGDIELRGDSNVDVFSRPSLNTISSIGDGGDISLSSTEGNVIISDFNLSSNFAPPFNPEFSEDLSTDFNGGNLAIDADKAIEINNSFIDTLTNSFAGRGGDVIITAGSSLRLEDTRIDTANFGDGRSGDITITALNQGEIELVGTEVEQIDIVDNFNDLNSVLSTAEAVIFVDAFGNGGESFGERQAGGDLTIRGGEIRIENYNLISRVNEFGEGFSLSNPNTEGNAGDIFIEANSLAINNSSLVAGTLGDGNAGNIELRVAGEISLTEGTQLSTRTESSGSAGVVNVDANSLTIDQSSITASNEDIASETTTETLEIFAGNINLNLNENLVLRNDSTISAIADGNANGGNINIQAASIIAFPSVETGSDIIASATERRGGTINITVESILGIQENSQANFSNDIDASSGVDGLDGTVSITTSNVEALKGSVELARDTLNPNDITARTCSVDDSPGSTLAVKNTIPTPPNTNRPLIPENIIVSGQTPGNQETSETQEINLHNKKIVPARGLVVDEKGHIALVAYPTPDTVSPRVYGFANCQK